MCLRQELGCDCISKGHFSDCSEINDVKVLRVVSKSLMSLTDPFSKILEMMGPGQVERGCLESEEAGEGAPLPASASRKF